MSEFLRFGPLAESLLGYPGEVFLSGFNVVRDLALDAEDLWMDVEHKVRKNVQKATTVWCHGRDRFRLQQLGLFPSYLRRDDGPQEAGRSYYFSRVFFERLCKELVGSYAFFHTIVDGTVVSTELVLVSDESVYSFLGGTNPDAFSVRPNDLLKYTIIKWAQSKGKKRFIPGWRLSPRRRHPALQAQLRPERQGTFQCWPPHP